MPAGFYFFSLPTFIPDHALGSKELAELMRLAGITWRSDLMSVANNPDSGVHDFASLKPMRSSIDQQ